MRKKRILVLTSTFPRWKNDTTPSFIFDLYCNLHNKNLNISVLAPHSYHSKLEETLHDIDIHRFRYFFPTKYQRVAYEGGSLPNIRKYFLVKIQVIPFILSELVNLLRIIPSKNIEIVHSHWIIPHGFLGALMKKIFGIKHVATIHAGDLALLDKLPFKKQLARFIVNNSDHITIVSHFGKDLFVKILGRDEKIDNKLSIIPMGIDTKTFSQDINSYFLKRKYDVTDKNIILCIGRLAEKKGLEYLIRAIKIVIQSIKKIKVYIVGEGPLKEDLLNLTRELGMEKIIEFTGPKSGKAKKEYFTIADILAVPSIKTGFGDVEGMPVVLMEGFASGKAIIASRVGGIPEMITHNSNGLLVPEKDSRSLARSIIDVLSNNKLKLKLGQGAKKSSGKYDLTIIAEKTNHIYSNV